MLNTTLNNTVDIISSLVDKTVKINTKIVENFIQKQQFDEISNKIDQLSSLICGALISVNSPISLTCTQNVAIENMQLEANVNNGGTILFACSDLPEGLVISSTGLISGTPINAGEGTSNVVVSSAGAEDKVIIINWVVEVGEIKPDFIVSGFGLLDGNYFKFEGAGEDPNGAWDANNIYKHETGNYYLIRCNWGGSIMWQFGLGLTSGMPDYYCNGDDPTGTWTSRSGGTIGTVVAG